MSSACPAMSCRPDCMASSTEQSYAVVIAACLGSSSGVGEF